MIHTHVYVVCRLVLFSVLFLFLFKKFWFNLQYSIPATHILLISSSALPLLLIKDPRYSCSFTCSKACPLVPTCHLSIPFIKMVLQVFF